MTTEQESIAIQDVLPHNNCWGCGPSNEGGLQIKSYQRGDETVCDWQPRPPFFAGPEHVLNGGIIAAILDCHGICAAISDHYRNEGRAIGTPPDLWCVTARLNVTYLKPTPISGPVHLVAKIRSRGERSTVVDCALFSEGEERARAEVVAVRVPNAWRNVGDAPAS